MAGIFVKVIDTMSSAIPVGKVFSSKRDLFRAMPRNTQIGVEMEYEGVVGKHTITLSNRTYRVDPYGQARASSPGPSAGRSGRPGRTVWKVVKAGTSGLAEAAVFKSRSALVLAAKSHSEFVAEDLATNKQYRFNIAGATYRVRAI